MTTLIVKFFPFFQSILQLRRMGQRERDGGREEVKEGIKEEWVLKERRDRWREGGREERKGR